MSSLAPISPAPLRTIDLITSYYGAPLSTTTRFTQITVGTGPTLLVQLDPKRVQILIQWASWAVLYVQHSLSTNGELPLVVPPYAIYEEDWLNDADQATTEFWGLSTGLDQFGNPTSTTAYIIERLLL